LKKRKKKRRGGKKGSARVFREEGIYEPSFEAYFAASSEDYGVIVGGRKGGCRKQKEIRLGVAGEETPASMLRKAGP